MKYLSEHNTMRLKTYKGKKKKHCKSTNTWRLNNMLLNKHEPLKHSKRKSKIPTDK